jgi:hypothetical protein
MAKMLSPLFNAVWCDGRPPEQWLHGVILYFHKSGPSDEMANYRGITLLDVVSKLFHKVLAARLLRHAEDNSLLSNTHADRMLLGRTVARTIIFIVFRRLCGVGRACASQRIYNQQSDAEDEVQQQPEAALPPHGAGVSYPTGREIVHSAHVLRRNRKAACLHWGMV